MLTGGFAAFVPAVSTNPHGCEIGRVSHPCRGFVGAKISAFARRDFRYERGALDRFGHSSAAARAISATESISA